MPWGRAEGSDAICGICGGLGIHPNLAELRAATDLMYHRGPDEDGYYLVPGVALGMRRLRIIDLAGGQQPKTDENGRYQLIFNGEIYNYRELRQDLAGRGHTFASASDTEVIVHAFEEWGPECFRRLDGIFAIAIWDTVDNVLTLARDHLGVKPLFYATGSDRFVFGSELKPLLALLGRRPTIDATSCALYFRYQYVPAPRSIYQDVFKLLPGHYLQVSLPAMAARVGQYWNPLDRARVKRDGVTREVAEDLVDDALSRAVRRQLVSDVPLGAFLSGGIDSSAVVAAMQRVSNSTVKTFSIGFDEREVDESRYAEAVARYLGTDHTTQIVREDDALDLITDLPHYYDEPFADASAVPTFLVSQLARRHVTVSLSGDGGDELFSGYNRYEVMRRARHWWSLPGFLRSSVVPAGMKLPGKAGSLFRKGDGILAAQTRADAYRNAVSVTHDRTLASISRLGPRAYQSNPEWPSDHFSEFEFDEAMTLTDLVTYLPDDILTKVDRASMANSLEARVPLLDPPFVELALSIPVSVKLEQGPKTILKNVLRRYVPPELVDRPKQGFGIPIDAWLRGGLREPLIDYLSAPGLDAHGQFRASGVENLLREHLSGRADRGYSLWPLLAFQIWYEHHVKGQSPLNRDSKVGMPSGVTPPTEHQPIAPGFE